MLDFNGETLVPNLLGVVRLIKGHVNANVIIKDNWSVHSWVCANEIPLVTLYFSQWLGSRSSTPFVFSQWLGSWPTTPFVSVTEDCNICNKVFSFKLMWLSLEMEPSQDQFHALIRLLEMEI